MIYWHGPRLVELSCLWQVLAHQPELPKDARVPGEDDDAAPSDSAQLGDPGLDVGPVVHGEQGHDRIGGVIGNGQRLCTRLYDPRRPGRTLSNHDRAGFDGKNGLRWLVGAGAGTDVDH
jgi:hypothetical protein